MCVCDAFFVPHWFSSLFIFSLFVFKLSCLLRLRFLTCFSLFSALNLTSLHAPFRFWPDITIILILYDLYMLSFVLCVYVVSIWNGICHRFCFPPSFPVLPHPKTCLHYCTIHYQPFHQVVEAKIQDKCIKNERLYSAQIYIHLNKSTVDTVALVAFSSLFFTTIRFLEFIQLSLVSVLHLTLVFAHILCDFIHILEPADLSVFEHSEFERFMKFK